MFCLEKFNTIYIMHIKKQHLRNIIQEEVKSELNESRWWRRFFGAGDAAQAAAGFVPDPASAAEKLGSLAIKKRARRGMDQVSSAYRKIPKKWVKCQVGDCKYFECKGKCGKCKQKPFQAAIDAGECRKIEQTKSAA
tara:strand:- start:100 stop:510 length:411 start_codon:yes stop_codon:yes gene_type:complete